MLYVAGSAWSGAFGTALLENKNRKALRAKYSLKSNHRDIDSKKLGYWRSDCMRFGFGLGFYITGKRETVQFCNTLHYTSFLASALLQYDLISQ